MTTFLIKVCACMCVHSVCVCVYMYVCMCFTSINANTTEFHFICAHSYIYWTESGASPRICRLPMNSTSVEVLFLTDLVQPLGITLDLLRGLLFWADPGKQSIEYSTLSGRGRGIAVSSVGLRPFQIALHRNYLIWTSQGDTVFCVAEMLNASRIGKLSVVNSLSEMFPLHGIAVVNQNRRQSVDIGKYWGLVT